MPNGLNLSCFTKNAQPPNLIRLTFYTYQFFLDNLHQDLSTANSDKKLLWSKVINASIKVILALVEQSCLMHSFNVSKK